MLTNVKAGPYTIKGVSLGGIYTSLYVQELDAMLDVGMAPRQFASARNLFISHGHADHIGAIGTLMGIRGLHRTPPPRVFVPAPIADDIKGALDALAKMQRYDMHIDLVPMEPGDEQPLKGNMVVRAFRTHHPVPSLGYQFVRRTQKLKPEFAALPGTDIARRKAEGQDLFFVHESAELAYATDTLLRVIDTHPSLLQTRVLIMECSFLDEKKDLASSRAGCHVHLDEVLERADDFQNEALVLMHFSQLYEPSMVREILERRCPPALWARIIPFLPQGDTWTV
jgi:ribonuclease Z